MKKIILLILIMFLGGCYDYRELNNMAVIDGIAIDYKDNEYEVKLEVIKVKKGKDGQEIESEILEAKDKLLSDAFYKATKKSNKEAYLGHVSLLVISEELANNGINDVMDYVLRDIQISNDYSIVISDNMDLFDIESKDQSISQKIVNTLDVTLGKGNSVTIDMVGNQLLNDNKDLVIPYLDINEDEVKINKIGYFKKDKLENVIDSRIYNFLMLEKIDINFSDGNNVINVFDKNIKFDVKKDKVIIDISCSGKVMDIDKEYNLNKGSSYIKLERLIGDNIKEEVNKFIKEYKDLIGINDMYYRKYSKEKDISNVEVKVDLKISKNGAIYEVLDD